MNKQEAETSVCIVMDYKMRYEPMCFREFSLQWFGRRRISWHGSVVFFKPLTKKREETNRDEDDMDTDDSTERFDSFDSFDNMNEVEQEMQLGVICVDHIVETYNEQDRLAV